MMAQEGEPALPPAFVRGSARLSAAFELARDAHEGQLRKRGDLPYIHHPLAVAERLHQAGFGEDVIAAAILHDVLEDSEVEVGQILEQFGPRVAELVEAMTDDPSIDDWVERKQAHRAEIEAAGGDAAAIYAADKLSNVRDLRLLYRDRGERAAESFTPGLDERVALWRDDLAMAERVVEDEGIARDFRDELAGFAHDRRGAAAR